jgi:hypothetical protein
MGVYTRLEDVPAQYRLDTYAAEYHGRDVWQEYIDSRPATFDSTHYRNSLTKAGSSWVDHVSARDRHHALAHPADVESWVLGLRADRTLQTVYKEYWVRLEEFYSWLQFHTDHPHVYHPPLMAAVRDGVAGQLWQQKFDAPATAATDGGE